MPTKPIKKTEEPVKETPPPKPPPIDVASLRRNKPLREEAPREPPAAANELRATVVALAFNSTRDKIREMTIVDRMQGRILPLLDLEAQGWEYVIEIATYRMDSNLYARLFSKPRPEQINPINEYTYRLAQWQKSVAGKNLERATDIALAETENKGDEEGDDIGRPDPWAKE
jgi:hypothetical protein